MRSKDDGRTVKSRTDRPMPDALDANGNVVTGGAEGTDTTITGQLRYWRDYGAIADAYAWAYGTNVQAWDDDGAGDDRQRSPPREPDVRRDDARMGKGEVHQHQHLALDHAARGAARNAEAESHSEAVPVEKTVHATRV